ncbi:hypothetical protein [Dyella terrae]|uniref:hypothetical protein n=1 Tax=Dyella terrae TaxID=522259 RepID=UPI001EFC6201|nr:hypothetical protein [Dyella terrae]ULU24969.1 hypothetical protein DYST_01889 [Dyella terrae]
MNFANWSIGRLVVLALTLSAWTLASAAIQSTPEQIAPTPGEEYRIAPGDLKAVEGRAIAGDVPLINRLIEHYMLFVGDEAAGIFWLERLGDTGDQEARATVLHYLQRHPADGTAAHIDELRKRWNAPRQ